MLELLLASLCVGSSFNPDACTKAWEKEYAETPQIGETLHDLQHTYYDSAPDSTKLLVGAGGIFYKREVKVNVYKGWYIEVHYNDSAVVGFKWSFP